MGMTATTLAPSTLTKLVIHAESAMHGTTECIRYTCHFPDSGARRVHQTGEVLSETSKGLTVNLYQRKGKPAPHSFEFFTDDEEQYAEGGLWFQNTKITEYDGVFSLPKEVIAMLKFLGMDTEYLE